MEGGGADLCYRLVGQKQETTTASRELENHYEAPVISADNRDDIADSIGEKVKCVFAGFLFAYWRRGADEEERCRELVRAAHKMGEKIKTTLGVEPGASASKDAVRFVHLSRSSRNRVGADSLALPSVYPLPRLLLR